MIDSNMQDDSTVYKTLLESTKAIPWKIEWHSMSFTYIGPQIEPLLGWRRDSWLSANDWAARIHEDDRERVVSFCLAQSKAGTDHEADYRALKADGGYIWIRDVVHVVRNEAGEVDSLIGFMFDITERKKTELELLKLQRELEVLSFTDALTGVANRRMLDTILEIEWLNAQRSEKPLAFILLDIDYFKRYNDYYGHVQGDLCLQQVAGLLNDAVLRPRDFLARFGGEEFVLLLPETDEAAALNVASRCREAILKAQIPHAGSPAEPHLTISLGVGACSPRAGDDPTAFIEMVDQRLYQAKQKGRNCAVASEA